MAGLRACAPFAAVLILLAVATVPAVAQLPDIPDAPGEDAVTVDVTPFPAPLRPGGPGSLTPLTVSVACHALLAVADPENRTVTLAAAAPDWAAAAVFPEALVFPAECTPGTPVTGEAVLFAAAKPGAVAHSAGNVTVSAHVNGSLLDAAGAGDATITVAYLAGLTAESLGFQREGRPGLAVRAQVNVANTGNGDALVTLAALNAPGGWTVEPPAPAVVPKGAASTFEVRVTAPADAAPTALTERLTLRVEGADVEGVGEDVATRLVTLTWTWDAAVVQAEASAEPQGDRALPAPAAVAGALALAAAAITARRGAGRP